MGLTMTQKIMAAHSQQPAVQGSYIYCDLDMVLGNDITAPVAIDSFYEVGDDVFSKDKIALVPDHFAPNKDLASAGQCKKMREFAIKHDVSHYFEIGEMGIEHVLLPEKGLVTGGDMIIGADSHTCTYGALGAFSTGIGSTDLGCAMHTGKCWFRVPEGILVEIIGKKKPYVSGKDIILYLIGLIGVDGARYQSLEFTGDGLKELSMDDRLTISNMAIEAGAKNGIFEIDDITKAYFKEKNIDYQVFKGDPDSYVRHIVLDLNEIEMTVAKPHLPENTVFVKDIEKIHVDQVMIGSCTNGRLSDLEVTANLLKDQHILKGMRLIVIPGSQKVYLDAIEKGYIQTIIKAGGIVSTPTCGPCLGGHMGVLAKGEKCLATTNRNFVGRMGHKESEVYLASPAVAAMTSIKGYITGPGGNHA